jgi:hypothetical protein
VTLSCTFLRNAANGVQGAIYKFLIQLRCFQCLKPTNQGVVGSNPAGRANHSRACIMQALVIFGLCQICAIGRILHDTQGVETIRVRGEMLG